MCMVKDRFNLSKCMLRYDTVNYRDIGVIHSINFYMYHPPDRSVYVEQ